MIFPGTVCEYASYGLLAGAGARILVKEGTKATIKFGLGVGAGYALGVGLQKGAEAADIPVELRPAAIATADIAAAILLRRRIKSGKLKVTKKPKAPNTVRSLSDRISDFRANPQNWERVSSSAVQSTNRRARGGISIENVYRNRQTGETIHVHDVFDSSGSQIPKHPSFRDYGKEQ